MRGAGGTRFPLDVATPSDARSTLAGVANNSTGDDGPATGGGSAGAMEPTGGPSGDPRQPLAWRVAAIAAETVQGFFADRCPQHAAAIAFRALFSLFPLAIVLVAAFGLVLRDETIKQDVVAWIVDRLPVDEQGEADVANALDGITTPASLAAFLTLVLFAWTASGMMGALRIALDAALGTRSRPAARGKAVDLALVGSAGALVLLVFASNLVLRLLDGLSVGAPLVDGLVRLAIAFGSVTVAVLLLLRHVPAHDVELRHALPGALVTAGLTIAVSSALDAFFRLSESWSVLYGSVASVAAFLYSIYLYAVSILIGAEVCAALARPPSETPAPPVSVQLRNALIGLFRHVDEPGGPPAGGRLPPP